MDPGPEVMEALARTSELSVGYNVTAIASAGAQLEAGEAAVSAGSIEAGLVCLRRAIAESHAAGDSGLEARSLLAYGSALVHAAWGRSVEAATALQRCILVADESTTPEVAAAAHVEFAYMESLAGRYERAEVALSRAGERLDRDSPRWMMVHYGLGACRFAQGRYGEATELTTLALEEAEKAGDVEVTVQTLVQLGLIRLLRRELGEARGLLERALQVCRTTRLIKLIPYPKSLLGEIELLCGDAARASRLLEQAFALGCQLADPCWEGLSRRGIALLAAARGELDVGVGGLEDAYARADRHPDSDKWIVAYILDALCEISIRAGVIPDRALNDLESLASRTGMREFLVRCYLHRYELGDPSAMNVARLLAGDVDNPHLHRRVMEAAPSA